MKTLKIFLIPILLLSSFLVANEDVLVSSPKKKIRVLLDRETSQALLEVRGAYYIFNPYDNSKVSSGLLGKRFIIRPTANGLRWGGVYPSVHQIAVCPRSKDTSILLNGIQYDGNILIYRVGNKINIVNELSIESYIKSVLTQEFSLPLENEVMSSIAIAARTTAYFHASKHPDTLWHIKSTDTNYQGKAIIIEDSAIVQAIDATKDLILINSVGGKHVPFVANWTEHSAGKTAAYNSIYRKDCHAPTKGVEAPHAALDREESKWSFSIHLHDFAKLLNISENIQSIETYTDPASGKIYGIRCKNNKSVKDVDFFTLQNKLGKDNLLSNDFKVEIQGSKIIFTGHGKGDGVGICLYTAAAMAQNGEMAVKILSKFFPDTYLLNLSAIPQIAENKEVVSK